MITPTVVLALLFPVLSAQDTFSQFTFCRETSRGVFETQCVQLNPAGTGEFRFKRRGGDEVQAPLTLSPSGRDRFVGLLGGTNYLADAGKYESKRKVADLGRKHLILEMPSGRREAAFNYSELKEVNALTSFFEGIVNQEMVAFDLENAMQYERLSVPQRLDELEREFKANRFGDPSILIPVLDKVEQDSRLVNYARTHARKLKEELSK
jgi:hypothetical protein